MKTETCFKCGKVKVAIVNRKNGDKQQIQMVEMGYGKNRGKFKCKKC